MDALADLYSLGLVVDYIHPVNNKTMFRLTRTGNMLVILEKH